MVLDLMDFVVSDLGRVYRLDLFHFIFYFISLLGLVSLSAQCGVPCRLTAVMTEASTLPLLAIGNHIVWVGVVVADCARVTVVKAPSAAAVANARTMISGDVAAFMSHHEYRAMRWQISQSSKGEC